MPVPDSPRHNRGLDAGPSEWVQRASCAEAVAPCAHDPDHSFVAARRIAFGPLFAAVLLWVSSYGLAVGILAIAFCLGYPVHRRLLGEGAPSLLSTFIGLAVFSLAVCVLAWLRIFSVPAVALVCAAGVGLTARDLWADRHGWRRRWLHAPRRPALIVSVSVLIVVLIGFSVLALYPSSGFDATSYHLPLARNLIRHQGLVYDPFTRYSFFPQANEAMFAVAGLITQNQVAAAALEFSELGALVLLLPFWFAAAGRRIGPGFLAALLILASPEVIFTATTAYVDTWTLTFVLVGALLALDGVQHRSSPVPALFLAGAMVGEAAATKYTGALFAGIGVLAALTAGDRALLRPFVPVALIGGFALVAGPWYGWTFHSTGDPAYPFATSIFGNRKGLWTTDEIGWQDLVARGMVPPGFHWIFDRLFGFIRGVAVGGDIPPGRSPISWLFAGGLFGVLFPPAWRDRAYLSMLLASLVCLGLALNLSADPRYLVPALGLGALACGLAADNVLTWIKRFVPSVLRQWPLVPAYYLAAAITILHSPASYARSTVSALGTPPTSAQELSDYLNARVMCYGAVEYLNRTAGRHYRAWGYICEEARYFAQGLLISDVFSTGSRMRVFDSQGNVMPSDRILWDRLRPLRVRWVILPTQTVQKPAVLERHGLFTLVKTVGPDYVFRMQQQSF